MKLMLRKVQYAPEGEGAAPSVEITKDFVMSDKPLHVKASLDKEVGRTVRTLFILPSAGLVRLVGIEASQSSPLHKSTK